MEEERTDPPADEQSATPAAGQPPPPTADQPEPRAEADDDEAMGAGDAGGAYGADAEMAALAEADEAATEDLVADLEAVVETAARSADESDTAFSEDLDPETLAFGAPKPLAIVCQWCNGPLETTGLEVCPHCGSRLKPADENLIVPGVTTLSSEAARALELAEIQRNRQAAQSGQAMYTTPSLTATANVVPAPDEATIEAANRPPDDEVRRLMLEMEAEARRSRAIADARHDVESMIVADAAERIEADAAVEDAEAEAASDRAEAADAPEEGTEVDAVAPATEAPDKPAPPEPETPPAS